VKVVTCAGGAPWEVPFIDGLARRGLGVHVLRRCVEAGELLGVAMADRPDAALVAAELPWLDRELVEVLAEHGVAVVAVDGGAGGTQRALEGIGVARRVRATDPPEEVARALFGLDPDPPTPAAAPRGSGRVVAVWGAPGAPGRTTVAAHLAALAARSGIRTLLADADVWAPSVAQLLGLREDPSVLRATRLAAAGWPEPLDACLHDADRDLVVLTGLPRPELWIELRARSWIEVLAAARAAARLVVCDLAAPVEEDEDLVTDRIPYRRNAVTLATLQAADQVLAVVRGDPVGVRRGVLALRMLREELPEAASRVEVVVNHAPAAGRDRQDLSRMIEDWMGRRPVALLPPEPALAHAVWEGRLLPERGRRSRWLRELTALRVEVGPRCG
jgi:Mrp family chromosome partitioning ATPase